MKKLKFLLFLELILCIVTIHAQNPSDPPVYTMFITKSDQSRIKIRVDENTRINIGNKDLNHKEYTISFSTGKNNYNFLLTDVTGVKYVQGDYSSLIQLTNSNDSWRIESDKIIFDILTAGSTMSLYDINGNEYNRQSLNTGVTTVDIEYLPAGLYILRLNNTTTKFLKK